MWLLRQSIEYWAAAGRTWTVPELVAAAEKLPAPAACLDVNEADLLLPGEMPLRINAQLAARGLAAIDPQDAPAVANLIFHSLAACYAQVLGRILLHSGKQFNRLFIVGGGSQNNYLNCLTAAATGLEVIRGFQESSTIGNFAVQLARLENDSTGSLTPESIATWSRTLASFQS
jgi:rhamnulokinase